MNQPMPVTVPGSRLQSIDIFRGLTILTMIFVNDLSSVANIPFWLKHMHGRDGMTFVDVVFPAFLFIVGLAIPFAMDKRLQAGVQKLTIARHLLTRTLGLLVIGVFMVNGYELAAKDVVSSALWLLLLYLCIILGWNQYPKTATAKRWLFIVLRGLAFAGLVVLYFLFHSTDGSPFGFRWWGILGLIGWAYIFICLLYWWLRANLTAFMGILGLLLASSIAERLWSNNFSLLAFPWRFGLMIGGHGAIVLAGLIIGIVVGPRSPLAAVGKRIAWLLYFAVGLWLAGFFLRPLFGISKVLASPTWALYSAAYCCVLYVFLYWLVDIKGYRGWARPLAPAGENPLLAYILPEILSALLLLAGITFLDTYLGSGWLGLARSFFMAWLLVYLTGWLGRLGLRLSF